MGRRCVSIPVVSTDKVGNEIPGLKKITNWDDTNKALMALREAPEGFRFPIDKLTDFFLGRWSPPRRSQEEKKESPPPPPLQSSVIVNNVQFA